MSHLFIGEIMPAQDDKREVQQKKLLGFGNHKRDDKFDATYITKSGTKVFIDLKTKMKNKSGCTTKRRFTENTLSDWKDIVIIVSDYHPDDPNNILANSTRVLLPRHHKYFRDGAEKRLNEGTSTRLGYSDLAKITAPESIISKIRKQVHLNDPHIQKRVIDSGILLDEENPKKHFAKIMEEEYGKSIKNEKKCR
tara:strand:+ start:398 stop:982 length:585 start_codon:yes stop_codon:yes gene_type:complete